MPYWSRLTLDGFREATKETKVAVMVTGAVEPHGTHMALGTDNYLPEYLAEKIANQTKALVLPTIPFGDSWIFNHLQGTVTVNPRILVEYYASVMEAVFKQGFQYILALNGHGGNTSHLAEAARKVTDNGQRLVVLCNWWKDLGEEAREIVLETSMGHAAEDETSQLLHVGPELVDMSSVRTGGMNMKFNVISGLIREEYIPDAVFGDPRTASSEKGRILMEQAEEQIIELVEQLERDILPIEKI